MQDSTQYWVQQSSGIGALIRINIHKCSFCLMLDIHEPSCDFRDLGEQGVLPLCKPIKNHSRRLLESIRVNQV